MSMATGVEVRVPFMDTRVVECASSIDVGLKQKGKTSKWILKKVAENLLPKSIIYRSKSGFGGPLRKWLKNDLSDLIDEYLSYEKVSQRGIFKAHKIQKLIYDNRDGKADYSYSICIAVF